MSRWPARLAHRAAWSIVPAGAAVIAAALIAAALPTAASGAARTETGRTGPASTTVAALAPTTGSTTFSISYGDRQRSYLLHVPPQVTKGSPLPLVLNLHGATSNGTEEEAYSQMDATANEHGFLVAYPNGTPLNAGTANQLGWNAGECCGLPATSHVDDVGFLRQVIDDIAARTPVERSAVYVTGISNGGMMAHAMAAEDSSQVAAVASVSGQVELTELRPSRPVAVMEFHSVDDPIAKWDGVATPVSSGYHLPPVMSGIHKWVRADGCRTTPHHGATVRGAVGSPDAGESATRLTWSGCRQESEVVLWRFTGSGHVWPGSSIDLSHVRAFGSTVGRSIDLVNANEQMWQFFSTHRLPSH